MQKILTLDGWRGLAILAVLFAHFLAAKYLNLGRVGVELFFVLSGRLMGELLFIKNNDLAVFLKRRISRVWPALFVFVLIVSTVASVPGNMVLYALTFTSNYAGAYGQSTPYLDHLWSLCIEEHTYLFLAALAWVTRKYDLKAAPACLLAALLCMLNGAIQSAGGGDYYSIYWRTDTRAASILVSCALFLMGRELNWRMPGWLILALGSMGLLLSIDVVPDAIKYTLGTLCFALSISTIDRAEGFVSTILSHPALTRIGLLSYSLYLWQQPFAKMLSQYNRLGLLGAAVVCALASYILIERPARDWLNRLWAKPGLTQAPS